MALQRDSRGRIKRKCKKRNVPMKVFRKTEFLARYRLSKKVVRHLTRKFRPHNSSQGKKNGGGISHEEKMCLALRYFATGGIYSLCGDTQHVSKGLVCRAIRDVSDYFYKHRAEYITWPSSFSEKMDNSIKFYRHNKQKTPNVFGLVDGTHIPILTPRVNESCYVNKSSYHSINTTLYCNFDKRIMNVDARWAGSVNDAYAFHCSPVGDQVKAEVWGNSILLADSGYALKKNVFTPYKKPKTDKQRAFNTWHRKNRARVEQCIGLLKQRWRCLDSASGYLYHTPQRAAKIIYTCCCLHNVAMDHGLRIVSDPKDPWFPSRPRLEQPKQRTQQEMSDAVRKTRDDYCQRHF